MTAKTRHGQKAHRETHGADPGTPHTRLNRMHAMPNRAEGAPMSSAGGAPKGMPPPPQPQDNNSMAPPGAAPPGANASGSTVADDEAGEQS